MSWSLLSNQALAMQYKQVRNLACVQIYVVVQYVQSLLVVAAIEAPSIYLRYSVSFVALRNPGT